MPPGSELVPASRDGLPTRFDDIGGTTPDGQACRRCGARADAILTVSLMTAGGGNGSGERPRAIRRFKVPVCEEHGAGLAESFRRDMRA